MCFIASYVVLGLKKYNMYCQKSLAVIKRRKASHIFEKTCTYKDFTYKSKKKKEKHIHRKLVFTFLMPAQRSALEKFDICVRWFSCRQNGLARTFVHAKLRVHKIVTVGANLHGLIYNLLIAIVFSIRSLPLVNSSKICSTQRV